MTTNVIILPESDEAASLQTVTGWVSRNGRFWGDDERAARLDGSTHKSCKCGEIIKKNGYCITCSNKARDETYLEMPKVDWDGSTPLCIYDTDVYFFDRDSLLDYCVENNCIPQELRLVVCRAVFAEGIDPYEYYEGNLTEDMDIPPEILDAFNVLNKALISCEEPLCWRPGSRAISHESLPTLNE